MLAGANYAILQRALPLTLFLFPSLSLSIITALSARPHRINPNCNDCFSSGGCAAACICIAAYTNSMQTMCRKSNCSQSYAVGQDLSLSAVRRSSFQESTAPRNGNRQNTRKIFRKWKRHREKPRMNFAIVFSGG